MYLDPENKQTIKQTEKQQQQNTLNVGTDDF